MKFLNARRKRLGISLLAFASTFGIYSICFSLIMIVNCIIRVNLTFILLVTWLFRPKSERNPGTSERQSSSGGNLKTELQIIEKDIIDHFTALFLLWFPKEYIYTFFLSLPYLIHRNIIFWIPKSLLNATYLSTYHFALKEFIELVNGTANDRAPKKSNRVTSFLIYASIWYSHYMCIALILLLQSTVRLSLEVGLWILTQKQLYEKKPRQPRYSKEVEQHREFFFRTSREAKIGLAMKAEHMLIVVIWCPTDVVGIDFLITFLSKFERNLEIRERWSKDPAMLDSPSIFGGVMAEFSTRDNFIRATRALAVSSKYFKSITAKRLLGFILHAETGHPNYGYRTCKVNIIGTSLLRNSEEQQQIIKEIFSEFGIINKITFPETNGCLSGRRQLYQEVICIVEYAFATHAYGAKLCMDGAILPEPFTFRDKIYVEIEETLYEKQIMRIVKRDLIEFLEQHKFICY